MSAAIDLSGQVALVTGGGRGVGLGITRRFLECGADVVICGRNEPEKLPEAGGRQASFVAADVRKPDQVEALIGRVQSERGRLDVVVNNAGGAPDVPTAEASPRFNEAIVGLNLLAPLNVAQRAHDVMQGQEGGGLIINIASVSAIRPSPRTAAYAAAKAGLLALTQTLAVEWAPKIRVVAITVGLIETEQSHLHYGDEAGLQAVAATVPLGRLGVPDDVGNVCVFLASPLASYISGSSILMHGGGEFPRYLDAAEEK